MTSVTRRFEFAMGHTLYQHPGSCSHFHGHNYQAYVTVSAPELDTSGMIVDFADLKSVAGGFIDRELDHRFLIYRGDPRAEPLLALDETVVLVDWNPTAENLAAHLMESVGELLSTTALEVEEVSVWETSNCNATVRRS